MPNPPTPEELEGWEKTAERLWTQSGWSSADEDEIIGAFRGLLAEVKRLREALAMRRGWSLGGIEISLPTLQAISPAYVTCTASTHVIRASGCCDCGYVKPSNLIADDTRTPRTTPRL